MHADQFPRHIVGLPGAVGASPAPAPTERMPQIIAVTSGKGGVGKSSIAVNLGLTLARQGRRVCILDADTGLANVNILLGLRPRRSLEHVLSGECAIEEIIMEGPHGLRVVPGANGISECVNLDPVRQRRLVDELERIEGEFDYLLLDTAAGISETTLDFLSAAHRVLLVITPEPTSLTDAFSLLKLALRRHPVECEVVVNMAAHFNEARSVFQRFHAAVQKYLETEVNFLGFVQRDESMRTAVSLQHPVALFPEGDPSTRPFQRLADALEERPVPTSNGHSFSRFWFRRFLEPAGTRAAGRTPATAVARPEPRPEPAADEAPQAIPLSGPDRLEALRAECWRVLEDLDDPRLLAQWLEGLHAAYWDRFGRPAIDLHRFVERLQSDSGLQAEALEKLRRPSQGVGQDEDAQTVVPGPPAESAGAAGGSVEPEAPMAAAPQAQGVAVSDERGPDFGSGAARAAAARPASGPARALARIPHAYDPERFGSQQELARKLREMGADGSSLTDLLGRL